MITTQIETRQGEDLNCLQHAVNWFIATAQNEDPTYFKVINIQIKEACNSDLEWYIATITYQCNIEFDKVGDPILKHCACDHCQQD